MYKRCNESCLSLEDKQGQQFIGWIAGVGISSIPASSESVSTLLPVDAFNVNQVHICNNGMDFPKKSSLRIL